MVLFNKSYGFVQQSQWFCSSKSMVLYTKKLWVCSSKAMGLFNKSTALVEIGQKNMLNI